MLTGPEIANRVRLGEITIEPFDERQVGPNSYDLRMGDVLHEVIPNTDTGQIDTSLPSKTKPATRNDNGAYLLMPGKVYLGHTVEVVGSSNAVPVLHGRSTLARHGLAIHTSAGFGDIGWAGQWVLEIVNYTGYPVWISPGVRVGQVSFHPVQGDIQLYNSTYQGQTGIVPAKRLT